MAVTTLYVCLAGATALAALWDARTRRIPNALTGAVLLGAVAARGVLAGWPGAAAAAAIALVCLVAGSYAYGRRWLGGGDIKLLAGIAAAFGPSDAPAFLLFTGCSGGLLALVWVVQQRRLGRRIPYALAAAGGVALVFFSHAFPAIRISL